jgi:hypothetical protein
MSTASLQTLPVEIIHQILDNLDGLTICISFRYLCQRFRAIADKYDRYDLDLTLISEHDFRLVCRTIRPENVRSLILSENINTINQIIVFNRLVDIRRFTQLKSITLSYFDDLAYDNIMEHINKCSLTSFSIKIENSPLKRFGVPPSCVYRNVTFTASLSSIIAQPTLKKLCLHNSESIHETFWPDQCALKYLNINCCTLSKYYTILRNSPLLKTVVLSNCKTLTNYGILMNIPIGSLSFTQVTSLTMEKIRHMSSDNLELFLATMPSLVHLQLTSRVNLFTSFQWKQFIENKLLSLEKFQFYFSRPVNGRHHLVNPKLISIPFNTLFWLNKGWFVTCDYIQKLKLVRLYTIPICVPAFRYVPEVDKISCSTIDNVAATMDNVHVLISYVANILPVRASFQYDCIAF